eukprot:CAMPEP_0203877036 /NCGR_PEP_ID=MMETSP0359-20131031/21706_1 /ASSEMBLY_ACC=CAM_ASM_000338 /TAXON_ID=268821 /ORGANISM="Scrippsiella Hangoei, Strain SHTV-5" /LENGTH=47 /DNA_ID= /DNA_START= /DNA_END= /DNA_ORIENTATION=
MAGIRIHADWTKQPFDKLETSPTNLRITTEAPPVSFNERLRCAQNLR